MKLPITKQVKYTDLSLITVGIYYKSQSDAHVDLIRLIRNQFLFFYPHNGTVKISSIIVKPHHARVANTWKAL